MPDHDDALALYVKLGTRGLSVRLDGERIIITPAAKITPDLRAAIRDSRDALADLLQGDIWRYRRAAYGTLLQDLAQEGRVMPHPCSTVRSRDGP